jgi:hypothetical protein
MTRFQCGNGCAYRGPATGARFAFAILSFLMCLFSGAFTSAALISFSGTSVGGHPVSGTADVTLNAGADTVTVKLTNTTAPTHDAGGLFTGLDFTLGGLTPTMTSDTGIQRTIAGSGAFSDTGAAHNLSWSLQSHGSGVFELNFNPDAKDAIVGPPTAGTYSGANGSIKGNPGHNPFVAQTATFVFSVPGLEANTPLAVRRFLYGTGPGPANGIIIPEPATGILLAWLLIGLALRRRSEK